MQPYLRHARHRRHRLQPSGFDAAQPLRLDTLVRLRWLAVAGQSVAVAVRLFRARLSTAVRLGLPRGHRALGRPQLWLRLRIIRRATGSATDAASASARLRHPAARGAALPDRRPGEPVRHAVPGAGDDLGDGARRRSRRCARPPGDRRPRRSSLFAHRPLPWDAGRAAALP